MSNLPLGAAEDPDAPFNQTDTTSHSKKTIPCWYNGNDDIKDVNIEIDIRNDSLTVTILTAYNPYIESAVESYIIDTYGRKYYDTYKFEQR